MDFTLSKEHEMARTLFREFAEKEVKPLAIEVDETEEFPRATVEKMAKAGFMGIPIPKEYGGQGCDVLTYAMCVEELAKVCGTTAVIVSAHTSLCCDPILTYGTEEQKQKYLPDLASGRKIGAFGLTEPGAGTDAQGQQTKAVLEGDEWVLNGSKIFITNGKEADVYVIFAITGTIEKRGRMTKEISSFIVEKGTPGFSFGTKEKKMGIRGSSTYELIFTDCRIPKENMLGQQGKGFGIAMHTLDGGRIGIAAQAVSARVLLRERLRMCRRESSLAVRSARSRIHSSSLLIWLQRLRRHSTWFTRLRAQRISTQRITRLLTMWRLPWRSCMLQRWLWKLPQRQSSSTVVTATRESMKWSA